MSNKPIEIIYFVIISLFTSSCGAMAEGNWMTKWTNPDGTVSNPTPATFYEVDTQNLDGMMQVMGYYADNKRNRFVGKYTNDGEAFEGFWVQDNSEQACSCLLYTSDAADELSCVDLGGRRIIKKSFFQAEDGIRDDCSSRGLGDVYKRQVYQRWRSI